MIKESKYTQCRAYIIANTVKFGYKAAKAKKGRYGLVYNFYY